jgi:hypothetical protein
MKDWWAGKIGTFVINFNHNFRIKFLKLYGMFACTFKPALKGTSI